MSIDFVALAHDSETAEAFERGTLELLQRKLGFDAAFLMLKGHEPATTLLGLDGPTRERILAHGETYAAELLPVKQAALAARGVAVDTAVVGSVRVQETSYYREVVRSVGGQHSLMAYLSWQGQVRGALMLGRSGAGFSDAEVCEIECLLPTLALARAAYGLPRRREPCALPAALHCCNGWD
jgi:hypothetical protein